MKYEVEVDNEEIQLSNLNLIRKEAEVKLDGIPNKTEVRIRM